MEQAGVGAGEQDDGGEFHESRFCSRRPGDEAGRDEMNVGKEGFGQLVVTGRNATKWFVSLRRTPAAIDGKLVG
jgi:hypothetical protein